MLTINYLIQPFLRGSGKWGQAIKRARPQSIFCKIFYRFLDSRFRGNDGIEKFSRAFEFAQSGWKRTSLIN